MWQDLIDHDVGPWLHRMFGDGWMMWADAATAHGRKEEETVRLLGRHGGTYADPPPRSPDINPTEHLNASVKEKAWVILRSLPGYDAKVPPTKEEMVDAVTCAVDKLPHSIYKRVMHSHFRSQLFIC